MCIHMLNNNKIDQYINIKISVTSRATLQSAPVTPPIFLSRFFYFIYFVFVLLEFNKISSAQFYYTKKKKNYSSGNDKTLKSASVLKKFFFLGIKLTIQEYF